ncbi:MAG: M15 family metallopeptidase [Cyclobacteriaceae bacterium]
MMNAQEYCQWVEEKDLRQKLLNPTILIKEDNSPLVSLRNSPFNLVFEPSAKKGYNYYVREAIYKKIGRISDLLTKRNKKLIIRSVWRSFDHQRMLRVDRAMSLQKEHPEKGPEEIDEIVSYFIAQEMESMHATGGAVDALIYDLKNDCVMDFGTNDGLVIDLNKKCYPYHPNISPLAKANRTELIDLFHEEDFVVDLKEFWHFDYGNVIWAIEKEKDQAFYGIIKSVD